MLPPQESKNTKDSNFLTCYYDAGRMERILRWHHPRLEPSILPPYLAPLPCCPICECHHYPPIFQARIWKSPSTSSILPLASQQLPSASLCALISFYLRMVFFSPLSTPWLCSLPSISTDHGDLTSGPHHLVPTFPLVLSFTNFLCLASA